MVDLLACVRADGSLRSSPAPLAYSIPPHPMLRLSCSQARGVGYCLYRLLPSFSLIAARERVATRSPTQRPFDRLLFQQLGRVGMFLALVHLAARTHAPSNELQGRAHAAMPGQRVHEHPTGIAHHLRQLDQAACPTGCATSVLKREGVLW